MPERFWHFYYITRIAARIIEILQVNMKKNIIFIIVLFFISLSVRH
jgi:hypothetical protein